MGLFDKALGGQSNASTPLNKQEAFTAVLLVTIAADGHISNEEVEGLVAISNRTQLLKDQTVDEFNRMIRKLQALLQKQGIEFLLSKAYEALPVKLRETVFANAADLVFADGSVEDEEKQLLEDIKAALSVPDDLALKIVEVLQIKNRG
jgi:tellurite resistance protein